MPTIPTGQMERELRKLYLQWVSGLAFDSSNLQHKLTSFEGRALDLIESMGGQTASLGAVAGFPVPKRLDLSPYAGKSYVEMQQAAVSASIMAGLNSRTAARAMFRAGLDKSYRKLERLARTETVSAYWKNAWDSISDLPTLVMLWGSEDGPRTCAWCRERDGLVIKDNSLRDHPNGRCTPIPTLRSQVKYRGSVDRDGSIFHDPDWNKQVKASINPVTGVAWDPNMYVLKDDGSPVLNGKGEPTRRYVLNKDGQPILTGGNPITAPVQKKAAPAVKITQVTEYDQYKYSSLPSQKSMYQAGKLSDDELRAIQGYAADDFTRINDLLRTGSHDTTIDNIDAVMSRSTLSHGGMVERGQELDEWAQAIGFDIDNPQAVVGKSWKADGYLSTSVRDDLFDAEEFTSKQLQMEISVAPGTKGFTTGAYAGERELLLDRGLNLTVTGVEVDDDGMVFIKVIASGGKNR